jgi:hypothetical protein
MSDEQVYGGSEAEIRRAISDTRNGWQSTPEPKALPLDNLKKFSETPIDRMIRERDEEKPAPEARERTFMDTVRDLDAAVDKGTMEPGDAHRDLWRKARVEAGRRSGLPEGVTDKIRAGDENTDFQPRDLRTLSKSTHDYKVDRDANLAREIDAHLAALHVEKGGDLHDLPVERQEAFQELQKQAQEARSEHADGVQHQQPVDDGIAQRARQHGLTEDTVRALDNLASRMTPEEQRTLGEEIKRAAEQQEAAVAAQAQQYQQAAQQYAAQAAHLAEMGVIEIKQDLAREGIITAADLQRLQQTNPTRHAEIVAKARRTQSIAAAAAQQRAALQQAAQQQHAMQMQRFGAAADAEFIKQVPEFADPARRQQIQNDAVQYLQDMGLDPNQVAYLYNTNPAFRSAQAQRMIYDASQAHAAQKRFAAQQRAQRAERVKAAPPVQRPGVSAPRDAAGRFMNGRRSSFESALARIAKSHHVVGYKGAR